MDKGLKVFLGVLSEFMAIGAVLSIQWRIQHDSPIVLYFAFLVDRFGYVPYRDFFDIGMPGSHWVYGLIGRISGYQDIGFRLVDLFLLGMILLMTHFWMKALGKPVGVGGALIFGLAYLNYGPDMSMQREYLELFFIVAAILISSFDRLALWLRSGLTGVLFGLSAIIKPHAAIGLAVFFIFKVAKAIADKKGNWKDLIRFVFAEGTVLAGGFALPVLMVWVYLWTHNALGDFLSIAMNYWPLYASIGGSLETIPGSLRLEYLVRGYFDLGGLGLWLVPAVIGLTFAIFASTLSEREKRQVFLLGLLAISYSFYPVLSGQFFQYHWIIFLYFVIQLASLCFVKHRVGIKGVKQWVPIVTIVTCVVLKLYPSAIFFDQVRGHTPVPKSGRVDGIANYLQAKLLPGDRVQPLDWTGGTVQAMLVSRSLVATRFIYDFQFYHHVSNPFIQSLRAQFLTELAKVRPRFIVEVYSEDKPWPRGQDTTREFEGLRDWLQQNYLLVSQGNGYNIYEIDR